MNLKTTYIIWMLLIVISFFLLCGFAHQWKQIIILENVNIAETKYLYEDDVYKLTGLVNGKLLYSIDLDTVRERLLSNPYIHDVIMVKQIYGSIDIIIFEREIKASIFLDKFYYLDSEARLLPKLRLKTIPNVPVISGVESLKENNISGEIFNSEYILTAIRMLDTTKNIDEEFYLLISELKINRNGDFVLLTDDYAIPIIIGKENYAEKILMLSSFWRQFVMRNGSQNLIYIDARFKNQLVVKWKDNNNKNIL